MNIFIYQGNLLKNSTPTIFNKQTVFIISTVDHYRYPWVYLYILIFWCFILCLQEGDDFCMLKGFKRSDIKGVMYLNGTFPWIHLFNGDILLKICPQGWLVLLKGLRHTVINKNFLYLIPRLIYLSDFIICDGIKRVPLSINGMCLIIV